jgi:phosphoserine phosphatase RsbU/P
VAVLQVVRGGVAGTQHALNEERTVLGRHPNCQLVLQSGVVSRHHAQVLENHGTYFIEDLRSRNGTYVNEQRIEDRTELQDGDEIRLCDVVLLFLVHPSTSSPHPVSSDPNQRTVDLATEEDRPSATLDDSLIYAIPHEALEGDEFAHPEEFESPSMIRRLNDSDHRSVDPALKLRAILEITQALGRELQVDQVLPKMLETLFNIFPQAEQGFVLLREGNEGKLKVKASRTRGGNETDSVAVSMTVVRYAMQTGEPILSDNISDDSRFKNSTALSKMQIRSIMCVPMKSQEGEALGVIQIVTRDERRAFGEEDLDLLASLATQASLAVENARLHEEHVKRRELERDLEFATQVQLGFLPKSHPVLEGYSFAEYYESAQSVGGDYFDYVTLPDGRIAIAIGDVAGKGMPAALLMARLYSSTRFQLLTRPSIEEAVSGLNEEISSSGLGHRFITFLLMVLDPERHELTIINAGHLAPLLRSADGTVKLLGKDLSGLPLGIVPDLQYESAVYPLAPGDSLIAFTDGVNEAMNSQRQIYGLPRLKAFFSQQDGEITETIENIIEDVENFSGDVTSRDDTCLIGLRRSADVPATSPEIPLATVGAVASGDG